MKERVQKLMARANVGSRRACEELIKQGRVRVNGKVIHLGDQADPDTDAILVDGVRLKFDHLPKIYIAINKPKHVLSTNKTRADDDRLTIRDLVPMQGHLFTIGRLDADSEGLVVLTNDGELAHKLSHPRFQHTKTYRVVVTGLPSAETIEQWQRGVFLPGEEEGEPGAMTAPCFVKVIKGGHDLSILRVVMTEGKKRQIRRVAALLGHPVRRLTRTHIGLLWLGELRSGEWRELNAQDIKQMSTPSPELRTLRRERLRTGDRPRRHDDERPADRPAQTRSRSDGKSAPHERDERKPARRSSGSRPATFQNSEDDDDSGKRKPARRPSSSRPAKSRKPAGKGSARRPGSSPPGKPRTRPSNKRGSKR